MVVVREKVNEGYCVGEERCCLRDGGDLCLHLRKHRVILGEDLTEKMIWGLNLRAREMRVRLNGQCGSWNAI